MIELIKKGAKLSEENWAILWAEAVLFTAILALAMKSWLAFAGLFGVMAFIMTVYKDRDGG